MPDETTATTETTQTQAATDAAAATSTEQAATTDTAASSAATETTAANATADTNSGTESKATESTEAKADVFDATTLTRPDGSPLADDEREGIAAQAKTLGLSTQQAQQLIAIRATELQATRDQFLADLKADPELGGANFEATQVLARRGMDFFFPPGTAEADDFRAYLDASGLGNLTPLVRAFVRAGRARTEDTPVAGRQTTAPARKDTASVLFPNAK